MKCLRRRKQRGVVHQRQSGTPLPDRGALEGVKITGELQGYEGKEKRVSKKNEPSGYGRGTGFLRVEGIAR